MLQITARAKHEMSAFFGKHDQLGKCVRVYVQEGIWGMPSLELTLDEPRESDVVINEDGITYVVDRELLRHAGDITIDFMGTKWQFGFDVTPRRPISQLLYPGISPRGATPSERVSN
jgi:Fe-S cluster assembly iron-binding protein IscA